MGAGPRSGTDRADTPANLLAIEYLGAFELRTITFAGWFAYSDFSDRPDARQRHPRLRR